MPHEATRREEEERRRRRRRRIARDGRGL